MPTRRPISFRMWAIIRTVVVLPFVPVTAMIGMRAGGAGREQRVDDRPRHVLRLALGRVGVHPEARRGVHLDDGAAVSPERAAAMSGAMRSMPATSRPTTCAAVSAISMLSGCASMRPVDRRAAGRHVAGQRELDPARPPAATSSSVEALRRGRAPRPRRRSVIRVSTFSWPMPRRGSRFAISTSCAHRVLAVARDRCRDALGDRRHAGRRSRARGSRCRDGRSRRRRRRRGSRPSRRRRPRRTASSERRSRRTPRPWLPSSGLTTTGSRCRRAASTAASAESHDLGPGHRQAGRIEQPVGEALVGRDVDARCRSSATSSSPGCAADGRPGPAGRG